MISCAGIDAEGNTINNITLNEFKKYEWKWYWIDYSSPTVEETNTLDSVFHFHPLAIEDCYTERQRPKHDSYDGYSFFVLHALDKETLGAEEICMFLGPNFVVTYHEAPSSAVNHSWKKLRTEGAALNPDDISYHIIDKMTDEYFPVLDQIEDRLNEIEESNAELTYGKLIEEVFDLRSDLLRLRRTIVPMRDLVYRVLFVERLHLITEQREYYRDIYDHLLKVTEMIESNRAMTSDMRDNFQTMASNRMNAIMMTLTIVSTIFIPLTFIAGLYGMNFVYMPELEYRYGYFIALGVMFLVAVVLLGLFKRNGWFKIFR